MKSMVPFSGGSASCGVRAVPGRSFSEGNIRSGTLNEFGGGWRAARQLPNVGGDAVDLLVDGACTGVLGASLGQPVHQL